MKKCRLCGASHDIYYHVKPELNDKGFPRHPRKAYLHAHNLANKSEKKDFGAKGYDALKKIDNKLNKHELAGKNLKSGKIEISKKIPKKYRKEVAFHEKIENEILIRNKNV